MVDAKDLLGLEKPLVKLVETISEGVGVVGNDIFKFDAKKIKRIGEAKAEAEKKEIVKRAEGQEEALAILDRASKRFALEQYNRQINLENIIFKSKEHLVGQEVSDEPVDKDWASRFMSIAQEVSREEVQDLLAKVLAGEVKNPNSYSLRTLEVLKNLGRNELEIFKKFVGLSTQIGFFHLGGTSSAEKWAKYNLKFSEFIHLSDVGLFNPSSSLSFNIAKGTILQITRPNRTLVVSLETKDQASLGVLKFTDVGSQLYELLVNSVNNENESDYNEDFEQYLLQKGLELKVINQ